MAANRIFIVEDDHGISDTVALNLRYVGYEVTAFDDGSAAAASLEADHSYDLALLDIMLPGIDGFELFSYMEKYCIPVIYITAKADSASEIKGLRDGAEDYIVKPFEVITLLVRIEKVLARTGKLNRYLNVHGITIDMTNHIVTKDDVLIDLSPLEFDVLSLLARNLNRTVSRERILSEVWGPDYFGGTHTVDVRIASIRKKLGLFDLIKTIPKIGYRLEERVK
ncbi:MAG: response regulator transcription factor [Christensenellaceae bacterium]